MERVVNICTYFRGRLDIPSALQMSITDIQALAYIISRDKDDPEKQKAKEGEVVEDALIHGEV